MGRSRRDAKLSHTAYLRDRAKDAPCWICGQPIDYDARPGSTEDSYEPDHYLPVARHPEAQYDLANVRPSHRRCNRVRGARAGIDQLGRPSRKW